MSGKTITLLPRHLSKALFDALTDDHETWHLRYIIEKHRLKVSNVTILLLARESNFRSKSKFSFTNDAI